MIALDAREMAASEAFVLPYPVRRFSVFEYASMARAGILDEDDQVELLEGWIVLTATKKPNHQAVIAQLSSSLNSRLPDGFHIRIQSAITTADSSPEPHLAVVRGQPLDFYARHPQSADTILVIEVSESSLQRGRNKCRLYARAGIQQYWIVNLQESCIEVYSDPIGDEDAHFRTGMRYELPDVIESLVVGATQIRVAVNEIFRDPLLG